MRAGYKIIRELNILLQYFEGDITFDLLKEFRLRVFADPEYNAEYNRINDFRNASFNVPIAEVERYSTFEKNSSVKNESKVVLLTSNPNQVVTSMFYELYARDKNTIEVVSTLDRAFHFLSIDKKNQDLILDAMNELQHEHSLQSK